ncbi:MAG: hypothetical protein M0R33_17180 [Methylomonas sp.]|jgi:hypothetical protein|uniref:hypothetical protein n=1 Tax=Methylomonas sp. TaxID=418 RepID=UPI0025E03E5D|nr:hypothetical protein [Methylomonas sp.]MCK9608180.1 hypothetical protein [Methylomonas sp.]
MEVLTLLHLDDSLICAIYSWGYPEEMYRFREVCKRFAELLPKPEKCLPGKLLIDATNNGQYARCVIAKIVEQQISMKCSALQRKKDIGRYVNSRKNSAQLILAKCFAMRHTEDEEIYAFLQRNGVQHAMILCLMVPHIADI